MFSQLDATAELVLNGKEFKECIIQRDKVKFLIYKIIKRGTDIIFGLIGCLLLIPVAIFIKIITLCFLDFHSIFYCQNRIGKNGKEFKLYKFRSMIPDADAKLKKILKEDKEKAKEYRKMKKLTNDPRITKIGRILRKTSIDELPQMINVLLGQMTLIGNRPYLPREKKDMGKYYKDIIKTKPGLSGFWQVSLRSRGTFQQRLKMEQYYSKHCGLKFDIQIFFKTIGVVFKLDENAN